MKSQRIKQGCETRRSTAAEREELIKEFKASGLSRRAFAERKGINPLTFSSWFRKSRKKKKGKSSGGEFVRVALPPSIPGEIEIDAEIGSGVRLKIRGLDLRQAASFIREVSSC